jgi:hypothetical protein
MIARLLFEPFIVETPSPIFAAHLAQWATAPNDEAKRKYEQIAQRLSQRMALSLAIPTILVSCFRPMLIRIGLIHPGKR